MPMKKQEIPKELKELPQIQKRDGKQKKEALSK